MIYQLPDHILIDGRFFYMRNYRLKHLVFSCLCCICLTVLIVHPERPRVYFSPGPDCENNIIAAISDATRIDIAVYSISNPNIVNALLDAHKRGAVIRVITDRTQSHGKYSAVKNLNAAGVEVRTNNLYKTEHNKFAIFDNKYMLTGSYNWTTNATRHNSENCIFMSLPVRQYATRFNALWHQYAPPTKSTTL